MVHVLLIHMGWWVPRFCHEAQVFAYSPCVRGHGVLRVVHGGNAAARIVARLFLLPHAGDAVETRLVVTPSDDGEHWLRTFGTRALNTRQYPAGNGAVAERIGPLELRFRVGPSGGGTVYRQLAAALVIGPARLPLAHWCAPRVTAREDPAGDHRIRIDVRVELPLVGPILGYAGTIDIEEPSERAPRRASDGVGESEGRSPSDQR